MAGSSAQKTVTVPDKQNLIRSWENGAMCNGYRHATGCQCGCGPPYPQVDVKIRKLLKRGDRRSSTVAELGLRFHIPRANFFHLVDKDGKGRVLTTAVKALQHLADNRFGKGNIKVVPAYVEKGSIEVYVALVALVGGAYKFFKDYEALKKGVKAFVKDIKYASSKLNQVVRRKYLREERRSIMKTNQDRKRKDQTVKKTKIQIKDKNEKRKTEVSVRQGG